MRCVCVHLTPFGLDTTSTKTAGKSDSRKDGSIVNKIGKFVDAIAVEIPPF